MGEIIQFMGGQCGIQIGMSLWSTVCKEHSIEPTGYYTGNNEEQLERLGVYFSEAMGNRYIPRGVLFDLDPSSVQGAFASPYGRLFPIDNILTGKYGACNRWPKGHYTDGAERLDELMDITRRETEECDSLQGFQLLHSIGGGTGSGMGTLLISHLREEYPDRMIQTVSVMPSPMVSDCVIQPYNAILSLNLIIENADLCITLDNEAIYNICSRNLKTVTYGDLNSVIAQGLSGLTSCFRFAGDLNSDMRKMAMNFVPFPRLHYLSLGQSPICSRHSPPKTMTVPELTQEMFSKYNTFSSMEPLQGKFIAATAHYRGQLSLSMVEESIRSAASSNSCNLVGWIPDNIKCSRSYVPQFNCPLSSTLISNHTAFQSVLRRIQQQFTTLWRRKAFMHGITGEGMDEMEFTEADTNVCDLIEEYQYYQDVPIIDEEEEQPYEQVVNNSAQ